MSRWVYVSLAVLSLGLLLIDAAPAVAAVMMAGAVAAGKAGHWGYEEDRMDKRYEHIEAVPTVEDCEEMLARKGMRAVINDGKVVRFIEDDEVE